MGCCSLLADPTSRIQREHLEILPIGVGYGKKWILVLHKSSNVSEMGQDRPRVLLRTNRKSLTGFWLVSKSMTSDDLEESLCTLFQNTCVMMFLFIYF